MKKKERKWVLGEHPFYEDRVRTVDWASFGFEHIIDLRTRAAFRLSCKDFAFIYLTDIIGLGLTPSPGTLSNRVRMLRRLVRWMIMNQIYRFKDMTSGRMVQFLEAQLSGKALTKKHIRKYLHIFEKLWAYRGQYATSLTVDPSAVPMLYDLCDRGREGLKWAAIPIAEATDLIRDCLSFLEEHGETGLRLLRDIDRLRGRLIGLTHSQMRARAKSAHEVVSATALYRHIASQVTGTTEAPVRKLLRELIRLLVGAALIVILFFT